MPSRWSWDSARQEFCDGQCGHPGHWLRRSVHGCDGGCGSPDFPGRRPLPGDLALCGAGTLGVVTSTEPESITYPDGKTAHAWLGINLTTTTGPLLSQWSSRNPCVLDLTIWDYAKIEKKCRALAMPHLVLKNHLVPGWAASLRYVEVADVRTKFLPWWELNRVSLLDKRVLEASKREEPADAEAHCR